MTIAWLRRAPLENCILPAVDGTLEEQNLEGDVAKLVVEGKQKCRHSARRMTLAVRNVSVIMEIACWIPCEPVVVLQGRLVTVFVGWEKTTAGWSCKSTATSTMNACNLQRALNSHRPMSLQRFSCVQASQLRSLARQPLSMKAKNQRTQSREIFNQTSNNEYLAVL